MNDFNDNQNNNMKDDKSSMNNAEGNANSTIGSGTQWDGESYHSGPVRPGNDSSSAQWQNSSYTSGYNAPPNNPYGSTSSGSGYQEEPVWHQTTWEPPQYHDPGQKQTRRSKRKKEHGATPTWARVVAFIVGGFLISACSIGAFVGLVNNGTIKFGTSGSSGPAFAITKLIDSSSSSSASSSTGSTKLLTKQEVCKKVIPSVVLVQNYQKASSRLDFSGTTDGNTSSQKSGAAINDTGFFDFGDDNGNRNTSSGSTSSDSGDSISPASEGSGVIISSDGYIMTNAHVVDSASALKVVLSNGKSYEAKLIGSDAVTDLALIKISATGLTAAEFGDSSSLKIGDEVVAIGNPGGSELVSSATFGNISALNRTITDSDTGYTRECIQTDAAINPGNSGGALVNMYGQVVGINSSKLTQVGSTSAEGLGFAIPINEAQPIITSLKQYGYVKDRAILGISGRMIDNVTARIYGISNTGFVIQKITNPELTKAGATVGDIITKIDNTTVTSSGTITTVISKKKAGDTVKLTLVSLQTGKSSTISVKLIAQTGKS
ncbi:S1C family serine protease [Caproicibacterium lactatifermentans]|jgi:serine protease Do|nr:trypsin-like peptidase domain-containing protein [Caproicibacterium lactatifermentans]